MVGKTIAGYQVIEQVGKGGMATVYKAYQPSLDRDVAVKVLPPYYAEQDETFFARFKREAQAIARLRHPNILIVLDFGQEEDISYIVMEYVEAGTLKDVMSQPMTLKQINSIIEQIAEALDYAHQEGVIHRDIKPSNIMMPKPDWALLTDFGLAKMVGGSSKLTQSGLTVGTPIYMSPEQGAGQKVDGRTDIYSLGVILYEMVVGDVPYTAETPMAVVVKHITAPLPVFGADDSSIPEDLQRTVLKALAKEPDDRYQSAGELAAALNTIAEKYPNWAPGKPRPVTDPHYRPAAPPEADAPTEAPPSPASMPTKKSEPVSPDPTPPSGPAVTPAKKSSGLAGILAGGIAAIGIGALFLISMAAVLGFLWYKNQTPAEQPVVEQPLIAAPADDPEPPAEEPTFPPPPPEDEPAPPPPTDVPPPPPTAPPAGQVLFEDDFSNPNSGWDRFNNDEGFTDYRDGTYNIRIDADEMFWWTNPYLSFGDVRVEVDALLIDGSERNSHGIICAYLDIDNYYYAAITGDGNYFFWEQINNEWTILAQSNSPIDAINPGSQGNRIRLDCANDTMTLYVNGVQIDRVGGLDLFPNGDVGLIAETDFDPLIEVQFDNFIVLTP